jgi:hypothetical protein
MKLIIAGGRNYDMSTEDYHKLSDIGGISEIVSGGCSGADMSGEQYAHLNKIPVKMFYANWNVHGRAAGPIRNKQMAEYADAVALFPGGRGTESMFREAAKAGIKIYDFRGKT